MYQTPIFSELKRLRDSKLPWLDFKVYFGSNLSMKRTYFHTFNSSLKSDYENLLDGYSYEFLRNYAFDEREGFFSRINFGVISKILFGKYDAILFHGYNTITSIMILLICVLSRKKIIFRGESILKGDENSNSYKNKFKKIFLRYFFYFCHKILYSCSGNKKFFMFYGVPISKLEYIPCAVNNDFFQEKANELLESKYKIKEDIGINENDLVLAMCCSFTRRKRPLDLIEAVKNLDCKKNIFLLFIGDGPERPLIESSLKNTEIRYHITGFLGQNDISKYYLVTDISFILSDYDPSPKALNEAMNFSNCVVSTRDVGTSNDLIKSNINGFLIETGDIDRLSNIIVEMEKNRGIVKAMGKESLKIVKEFNYKKDVKAIERTISEFRNEF